MPSPPVPVYLPDLPYPVEARLALAWQTLLAGDDVLGPLFGVGTREGSIVIVEGSDLLEIETVEFPTLAVYVAASRLKAKGSSQYGELTTELHTQLLTAPNEEWGQTRDQLRLRICARIQLLALQDFRTLSDSGGDLNLAVTDFARVNLDQRALPSRGRLTVLPMLITTEVSMTSLEILE